MKTPVHSKLLCILLMVSMFALGIYCEDVHTNSFFSYAGGETGTASLRSVRSVSDTDSYCEKNSLGAIEHFVSVQHAARNLSVSRLSQLFVLALFLVGTYQVSFSFRNSFLHTDAYANQYRQRTLEYIHHNDGKKS